MFFYYCLRLWFYSNLLHPLVLFLGLMIYKGHEVIDMSGFAGFYFFCFVFSLLVSVPSLILANLVLWLLLKLKAREFQKFLVWLFLISCIAIINWIGFYFFIGQYKIGIDDFVLVLPSVLSAGFVGVITFPSFSKLLNLQYEKNDMV